jgi:hypothetical protein
MVRFKGKDYPDEFTDIHGRRYRVTEYPVDDYLKLHDTFIHHNQKENKQFDEL